MPNFYNSPYYDPNATNQPIQPMQNPYGYQQGFQPTPSYYKPDLSRPVVPDNYDNIQAGGFKFTVIKDDEADTKGSILTEDGTIVEQPKKRRGRPRKSEVQRVDGEIVRADDNPSQPTNMPTMYTYQETTSMLRGTLGQIDELAGQIKAELDQVSANRTLRNKYNIMASLTENLSDIMSTKISAIREINNAISRSNEMDYKREKDMKAAQSEVNDDKYIMDMYNAFIQNPMGNPRTVIGPTGMDATLVGSTGIVRENDQPSPQGFNPDTGYLSYVGNMTPEQKLMMVDNDPNIKMCVIFDASTGAKFFQYMNMSTGQTVDGLPTRDPMFMEDTTVDLQRKIARNINLNETYPVIVINEGVTNEY